MSRYLGPRPAVFLFVFLLTALDVSAGEVFLDWQASPGAVGYKVHHGPASGQYNATVDVLAATEWTVNGLQDCTTYYFATTAYNNAGDSTYSNEVSSWARPEIDLVTPASADQGDQLSLTIDGVNFQAGSTLAFSNPGVTLESIDQIGCNQIQVSVSVGGNAATGAVSLTVTHANGVAGSAAGLFSVDQASPGDTTPPTIVSASATLNPDAVRIAFNEALDGATATAAGNYRLSHGVSVSSATLAPDLRTVVLGTSALADGVVYTLTVDNVSDNAGNPIAADTQVQVGPAGSDATSIQITASADDAEEDLSGNLSLNSGDLELGVEGALDKLVGLRFDAAQIPPGAEITGAWIQFTTDETNGDPAELLVEIQAADDAAPFGAIGSRPRAGAGVAWSPPTWDQVGESNERQRTPDIRALIQRVIDRPGWAQGNALVLIISGSGTRTAEAVDGDPAGAPTLHVEFRAPTVLQPPPAPTGLRVF